MDFFSSVVCLHVYAFALNSKVHCESASGFQFKPDSESADYVRTVHYLHASAFLM